MRAGVLDVGSNTVRLEIADMDGEAPLPVHTSKYRLRLAEYVDADGRLPETAVERLVAAVTAAHEEADRWGAAALVAFATAIVRDSPNRDDVIDAVRSETGVHLQVMSGLREAQLTFLAARSWMGWRAGSMVLIDIGGGSLEVAFGRTGIPDFAASVPLGAGRLTREHLHEDPPPKKARKAVRRQVRHQLRDVATRVRWENPSTAVATSRTFQQLARLCGAPPGRHGPFVARRLRRADLADAVTTLAKLPAKDRAKLSGVSRPRSRQILAGALIAHTAMELMDLRTLTLSSWALREGLLLELRERRAAPSRALDFFASQSRGVPSRTAAPQLQ